MTNENKNILLVVAIIAAFLAIMAIVMRDEPPATDVGTPGEMECPSGDLGCQ